MSVNGITSGVPAAYTATSTTSASTKKAEETAKTAAEDLGVVYEPSSEKATDSDSTKTTDYSKIINQLNQHLDAHTKQMQNLVDQLLTKQSTKYTTLADMFANLKDVDPETVKKAQEDVSEDGEWGVEKTSERMFEMAKALSGGDPTKADQLIEAVKKGYDQAASAWGGDLPEISQKTVDAAIKKLQDWRDGLATDPNAQA